MTLDAPPSGSHPANAPAYRRDRYQSGDFGRILRTEVLKLRSVRSTWWSIFATALLMLAISGLSSYANVARWNHMTTVEQLTFDATRTSLFGTFLATISLGVLGVLLITAEYTTGEIHATFQAVPRRTLVLSAKALVLTVVSWLVGTISAFASFFLGQGVLSTLPGRFGGRYGDPSVSITAPHVLRAVFGAGLFLMVLTLFAYWLGAMLRSTAAGIAVYVAILLVLPLVTNALPSDWQQHVQKYLPMQAGFQLWSVQPISDVAPGSVLGPWAGFAVLCGYAAAAAVPALILAQRRDA